MVAQKAEPDSLMTRNSNVVVVEIVDQSDVRSIGENTTGQSKHTDNARHKLQEQIPQENAVALEKLNSTADGTLVGEVPMGEMVQNDHVKHQLRKTADPIVVGSSLEQLDNSLQNTETSRVSQSNIDEPWAPAITVSGQAYIANDNPLSLLKLNKVLKMSHPQSPSKLQGASLFNNIDRHNNFSHSHTRTQSSNFNVRFDRNGLQSHSTKSEFEKGNTENHSWAKDGEKILHVSDKSENSNSNRFKQSQHKSSDSLKIIEINDSKRLDTTEKEHNILSSSLNTSVRHNQTKMEIQSKNVEVSDLQADPKVHQIKHVAGSEKTSVNVTEVRPRQGHERLSDGIHFVIPKTGHERLSDGVMPQTGHKRLSGGVMPQTGHERLSGGVMSQTRHASEHTVNYEPLTTESMFNPMQRTDRVPTNDASQIPNFKNGFGFQWNIDTQHVNSNGVNLKDVPNTGKHNYHTSWGSSWWTAS